MVDKTWNPNSNEPFSQAELLQENVATDTTRAIFVNSVSSNDATINLWFWDNNGPLAVPLMRGEIYPFGIVKYDLGGSATSAEIWGLW